MHFGVVQCAVFGATYRAALPRIHRSAAVTGRVGRSLNGGKRSPGHQVTPAGAQVRSEEHPAGTQVRSEAQSGGEPRAQMVR